MKVIFIQPHFPREMAHYTRGLAEAGARVYGVSDVPAETLPPDVRRCLSGYLQIRGYSNEDDAARQIASWAVGGQVERVEALWEPVVTLAAKVRALLDVPGMKPEQAHLFRDKASMKTRLAEAGLRVPRNARCRSAQSARLAAEKIGYPLIIKPIAGAGSKDTYRVENAKEFEAVLNRLGHVHETSVEEYITGEEFTYDAVSIDGTPLFDSVMQYHPKPLEARSNEWISPAQLTFANPHKVAKLAQGIDLGKKVLKALGSPTGFTHMEWFLTPKGEVIFGEIAGRVGGGGISDMINWANDFDVFRGWASTVCWGKFEEPIQRLYNVAMVFKRAHGQGRIQRIEGLDRVRRHCGKWFIGEDLLPVGTPRRDWLQTLVSDGWMAVRHPDHAQCKAMMDYIIKEVNLYAS
jgi:hypothetical protein